MAFRYFGKNIKSFSSICNNDYGRKVYYTNQDVITDDNVLEELGKALAIHSQNVTEIEYLERYYMGDCPILYRNKDIRPEVNNKIVVNLAQYIVDTKVANMVAEPIQYILRDSDKTKAKQIVDLNIVMDSENKQFCDVSIFKWRSICGTAYRFIGNNRHRQLFDRSEFYISSENPKNTFVAYYAYDKYPAFAVSIRKDINNCDIYYVYTETAWFKTDGKTILDRGVNGNGAIPIIEYPNGERRLSDIEKTIDITDAINVLASDRINGVEQFVSSYFKFINCEIDVDTYRMMRKEGALVVKSNNGDNKADVDLLTQELNQSQSQVVFDDLFDRLLDIQGLPSREGNGGKGDTGNAVMLRNGHTASLLRAMIDEPIIKKSERMMLEIILNRLRINKAYILEPVDIEIQINHNRLDNLLVKTEALEILLRSGINPRRAIKSVDLFNDPELVANESEKRMSVLYPEDAQENVETESINGNGVNTEITVNDSLS